MKKYGWIVLALLVLGVCLFGFLNKDLVVDWFFNGEDGVLPENEEDEEVNEPSNEPGFQPPRATLDNLDFGQIVQEKIDEMAQKEVRFGDDIIIPVMQTFPGLERPDGSGIIPYEAMIQCNPFFIFKDGKEVRIPLNETSGIMAFFMFEYDSDNNQINFCTDPAPMDLDAAFEGKFNTEISLIATMLADSYIGYLYHTETGKPSRPNGQMSASEAYYLARSYKDFIVEDDHKVIVTIGMANYGKIELVLTKEDGYGYYNMEVTKL